MTRKTILIIELQPIPRRPYRPQKQNATPSPATPLRSMRSSYNTREQRRIKAWDNFVATITRS